MSAVPVPLPERAPYAPRLVRAWLLTALIDGPFSSVLSVAFYHSTVARLFQGVASIAGGIRGDRAETSRE